MKTINHEYYVSYEIAKLLKELGFDWECNYHYANSNMLCHGFCNNDPIFKVIMSAPTLEVAQRWLREIKGVHMCVKADAASINCKYFVTVIISDTKWGNVQNENKKTILLFNTYEEAQEAGIKKALEIILEKGE